MERAGKEREKGEDRDGERRNEKKEEREERGVDRDGERGERGR